MTWSGKTQILSTSIWFYLPQLWKIPALPCPLLRLLILPFKQLECMPLIVHSWSSTLPSTSGLLQGLPSAPVAALAYRQCLWDPVRVSITKHSPSLRQYARSLSRQGLKCSDRSVEYVVVSVKGSTQRDAVSSALWCPQPLPFTWICALRPPRGHWPGSKQHEPSTVLEKHNWIWPQYRLNVYVHPEFIYRHLITNMMTLGSGAFGRLLGHEWDKHPYKRVHKELLCQSQSWEDTARRRGEGDCPQQEGHCSRARCSSALTNSEAPWSGPPSLQNWEKQMSVVHKPPIYGIPSQLPEQTKTTTVFNCLMSPVDFNDCAHPTQAPFEGTLPIKAERSCSQTPWIHFH